MKRPHISVAAVIGFLTIAISGIVNAVGKNPSPQRKTAAARSLSPVLNMFTLLLQTPTNELDIDSGKTLIGKKTLGDVLGLIDPKNTAILVGTLTAVVQMFRSNAVIAKKITPVLKKLNEQIEQAETASDSLGDSDVDDRADTRMGTTTGIRPVTPGVHTGGAPADTALGATAAPQTD